MEKESFSQPEVKEQDISEGTDGLTQFKGQLKRFSWRVRTGLCAPPPSSSFKSFQNKYHTWDPTGRATAIESGRPSK